MTTTLAHVAGAPVEELLLPVLAGGGTMLVVAARLAVRRVTGKSAAKRR